MENLLSFEIGWRLTGSPVCPHRCFLMGVISLALPFLFWLHSQNEVQDEEARCWQVGWRAHHIAYVWYLVDVIWSKDGAVSHTWSSGVQSPAQGPNAARCYLTLGFSVWEQHANQQWRQQAAIFSFTWRWQKTALTHLAKIQIQFLSLTTPENSFTEVYSVLATVTS